MKTLTKLIQRAKVLFVCTSFSLISFYAGAQCTQGCDLIVNGSFENGNVDFTSTYDWDPDGNLVPHSLDYHDYTITTNALGYSANCGSNLMWVDGENTYPFSGAFWSQSVTLYAGTSYTFNFAAVNVHPGPDAYPLQFKLSGTSIGPNTGMLLTTWTNYTITFTVAISGSYTVELWETDTGHHTSDGNDFAIDCICLTYPCDCKKCNCHMEATLDHFTINDDGFAGVVLNIIAPPLPPLSPISKFRVTMVNYHSNVDVACLKCSTDIQEKFGTLIKAPQLFGVDPFYGPYELPITVDYSREVTWCFEHPVDFNPRPILLPLQFPPILDLKCCTNDVSFCLRVEFWSNECLACDRLICYDGNGHDEGPKSLITTPEEKPLPPAKPQGLKVIPNPASNNFKVVFDKENLNGTLQVFDLNGSLIKEAIVTSGDYTVNTKSYAEGMYLVKYQSSKGTFQERVVIKK